MAIALERPPELDRSRPVRAEVGDGSLLERVALTLNSTLELWEVLKTLAGLTLEVTGADRCSIFLLEGHVLSPVAAIGMSRDEVSWARFKAMGPVDVSAIPTGWEYLAQGRAVPVRDARSSGLIPLEWVDRFDLKSLVLVPLLAAGEPCGVMSVDYQRTRSFSADELRLLEAIGAYAGVAIRNARLFDKLERQLKHMEILHALGGTLARKGDAGALVARLNQMLGSDDIEVLGLVFKDRSLARRLGGDEPSDEERTAWRAHQGCVELSEGVLSVPMRLDRRLVGAVRVKPADLPAEERSFLEALAHGVAEIASRGALRATVEEGERERAVAAERGRIAADLHDTAGQLFVAIGLLARRESQHLPEDSQWRDVFLRLAELADSGKWEISRAIQALAFFPEARRGIAASLRSLTRSFERDSGIDTLFEITGSPRRLSPSVERAVYRVAHEALTNAWRHARCSSVRVELVFAPHDVSLTVADDGVGIRRAGSVVRAGLVGMRRALQEVGGTLRVRALKPHGTLVEARIARDGR